MSVLGMGRFPDLLGASAKKVNDAMHRFKKSASDTSWHFYRDGSFLTYLIKTIYLYVITCGCAILLLFRK